MYFFNFVVDPKYFIHLYFLKMTFLSHRRENWQIHFFPRTGRKLTFLVPTETLSRLLNSSLHLSADETTCACLGNVQKRSQEEGKATQCVAFSAQHTLGLALFLSLSVSCSWMLLLGGGGGLDSRGMERDFCRYGIDLVDIQSRGVGYWEFAWAACANIREGTRFPMARRCSSILTGRVPCSKE